MLINNYFWNFYHRNKSYFLNEGIWWNVDIEFRMQLKKAKILFAKRPGDSQKTLPESSFQHWPQLQWYIKFNYVGIREDFKLSLCKVAISTCHFLKEAPESSISFLESCKRQERIKRGN